MRLLKHLRLTGVLFTPAPVRLLARLMLLIGFPLLMGCNEPAAGSAPSPSSTIRPCPSAAQVLNDFIGAFNSADGIRVAGLVGASIHIVDDLPAGKFDSEQ